MGAWVRRRLLQISVGVSLALTPVLATGPSAMDLVTHVKQFTYAWHTSRIELQSLQQHARTGSAHYLADLRAGEPVRIRQAELIEAQFDAVQRQIDSLPDGPIVRQLPMVSVTRVKVPRGFHLFSATNAFAASVGTMSFTARTYWPGPGGNPLGGITNFASNEDGYSTDIGTAGNIFSDLTYTCCHDPIWGGDTMGYVPESELLCVDNASCTWKQPDFSVQLFVDPCNARYHARLWDYGPSSDGHWFTVGDAHHDNCEHSCLEDTLTAKNYFQNSLVVWASRVESIDGGEPFTSPSPCNYYVDGIIRVAWMTF